jgi:hypothetical protein
MNNNGIGLRISREKNKHALMNSLNYSTTPYFFGGVIHSFYSVTEWIEKKNIEHIYTYARLIIRKA